MSLGAVGINGNGDGDANGDGDSNESYKENPTGNQNCPTKSGFFCLVCVQGPDGVLTKTPEIIPIRFQNRSEYSEMLSVSSPYPPTGVKARETLQRIYKKRGLLIKLFCVYNRLQNNGIFFFTYATGVYV